MQKAIVTKRSVEVSRARKSRPIDIAHSLIPMHKQNNDSNRVIYAIFHKSMYGHVLIALNTEYQAINAWSDIKGIIPIKSRFVSNCQKFASILQSLRPQVLYLNDGEILQPIPSYCQLRPYFNKNLLVLLNELRQTSDLAIKKRETTPLPCTTSVLSIPVVANAKANTRHKVYNNETYKIPTFNDMKIMDPTITRKQYKVFRQTQEKFHI